jgi:type IV secretion system protein VirB8
MTKMEDLGQALFVEQKKLAEHFKEVRSFHAYREQTRKSLSRVMMAITGIALLGNLAQACTIATLVPLARIVPVYFWVRQDGTIDSSVSTSQLPPTQSQAVVNAALWQYVRLREGYTYNTAQYAYDVVSAFGTSSVTERYQKWFNYPNPESPQVTIANRGTVTISHISSFDIGPSIQQIRFERVVTIEGHAPIVTTMTATIGYAMAGKLPANARLDDPGGVLVTSYQSSEDSPK